MNRRDSRDACVLLATLWAAVAAQGQEVHKCTTGGQVTYQAKPCATGDVVLPAAPTPSDQGLREASGNLQRQHLQAATGHIFQPVHAAPPPPPPAPPPPPGPTSTTTTIVLPSGDGQDTVIIRRTKHARTSNPNAELPPPAPPANNCERLNRDNAEAQDRRDQLQAPSELASREASLQKARADVARIRDLALASNCRLTR